MKIYTYDRTTGAYLGESDADPSPMEPGKFLIPAFSTPRKPPAQVDNKAPVFDRTKEKWKLVEIVNEPEADKPAAAPVDATTSMRLMVQAATDAMAVALDFDSMADAIGYADEAAVPKYQMLARALRAWRSLVWFEFDRVLAEIKAGAKPPKDADALVKRLPTFIVPNTAELETVRADAATIPAEVEAFMKAQAARLEEEKAELRRRAAENEAAFAEPPTELPESPTQPE